MTRGEGSAVTGALVAACNARHSRCRRARGRRRAWASCTPCGRLPPAGLRRSCSSSRAASLSSSARRLRSVCSASLRSGTSRRSSRLRPRSSRSRRCARRSCSAPRSSAPRPRSQRPFSACMNRHRPRCLPRSAALCASALPPLLHRRASSRSSARAPSAPPAGAAAARGCHDPPPPCRRILARLCVHQRGACARTRTLRAGHRP